MFLMPWKAWTGCVIVAVAALVFVQDEDVASDVAQDAPAATRRVGADASPGQGSGERTTSAPMANPFSTALQTPQRNAGAAPAPAVPLAPPIPYAFAGRRDEGGRSVVILSRQGRLVAVHGPGLLDPSYEVEAIDERHVVLRYLPTMARQLLPLPASRPAAPHGAAASLANAPEPEVEEGN